MKIVVVYLRKIRINGLNEVFEVSSTLDLARMFGAVRVFVVCMRGITVDPSARVIGSMSPSPTASIVCA